MIKVKSTEWATGFETYYLSDCGKFKAQKRKGCWRLSKSHGEGWIPVEWFSTKRELVSFIERQPATV